MKEIKIKCPAKINLDLFVEKKDPKTGFHNIKSIMQAISLFDILTIKILSGNKIKLSGTSSEIPYDEHNICYKAAKLFLEKIKKNYSVEIYIEKNIPVCAGLAGGSTDGAGVLYALNKLLDNPLKDNQINELAASLGSDLNFCLKGGTKLCKGRGEKITDMPFYSFDLCLVKPKNLQISAKEAYTAFDNIENESNLRNDLEFALLGKYPQIDYLHSLDLQMSGSGPTFFKKSAKLDISLDEDEYLIIENLHSIDYGIKVL